MSRALSLVGLLALVACDGGEKAAPAVPAKSAAAPTVTASATAAPSAATSAKVPEALRPAISGKAEPKKPARFARKPAKGYALRAWATKRGAPKATAGSSASSARPKPVLVPVAETTETHVRIVLERFDAQVWAYVPREWLVVVPRGIEKLRLAPGTEPPEDLGVEISPGTPLAWNEAGKDAWQATLKKAPLSATGWLTNAQLDHVFETSALPKVVPTCAVAGQVLDAPKGKVIAQLTGDKPIPVKCVGEPKDGHRQIDVVVSGARVRGWMRVDAVRQGEIGTPDPGTEKPLTPGSGTGGAGVTVNLVKLKIGTVLLDKPEGGSPIGTITHDTSLAVRRLPKGGELSLVFADWDPVKVFVAQSALPAKP